MVEVKDMLKNDLGLGFQRRRWEKAIGELGSIDRKENEMFREDLRGRERRIQDG